MILRRALVAANIIFIMVFLDQYTKNFFIQYLKSQPAYVLRITSFLDIVHSWNYGISMGFFSYHQYSNAIFLILNSCIVIYLLLIYIKDVSTPYFYLIVIGGGMGNLFDRFTKGAVFDFISLHYSNYYFPAFNLADAFISIGVLILFYDLVINKRHAVSDTRK